MSAKVLAFPKVTTEAKYSIKCAEIIEFPQAAPKPDTTFEGYSVKMTLTPEGIADMWRELAESQPHDISSPALRFLAWKMGLEE